MHQKDWSFYLRVSLSLSSRGRHWIVRAVSFQNLYFMWVCEASKVNIWTVFAVGPNGAKNNKNKNNNFASSGLDHRVRQQHKVLHIFLTPTRDIQANLQPFKCPRPHMGLFTVPASLCVNPEEVSGAISLLALTNQPKTNRRKLPK